MKFIILMQDGSAIDNKTILKHNEQRIYLKTHLDICAFIKRVWCKENNVKSFTQWAKELNEDVEYESNTYTKYDALDNLSSNFTLNIDGKHVDLYKYFTENMPFKVA